MKTSSQPAHACFQPLLDVGRVFAPHPETVSQSTPNTLQPSPRRTDTQVSLLNWRLLRGGAGGLATAFLSREAIAASIAVPGTTVRTFMGPGRVQLVREDGVAVVVVSFAAAGGSASPGVTAVARASQGRATLFLQLSAILGPAKATLGERVDTSLGSGVVCAYHAASDTYVVHLGEKMDYIIGRFAEGKARGGVTRRRTMQTDVTHQEYRSKDLFLVEKGIGRVAPPLHF